MESKQNYAGVSLEKCVRWRKVCGGFVFRLACN